MNGIFQAAELKESGHVEIIRIMNGEPWRRTVEPRATFDLDAFAPELSVAERAAILAAWAAIPLPPPPPAPSPGELTGVIKPSALARVDAEAEAARQKWITPGAGMALTYEAKRTEAVKILADPAPDPANYPLAAARAQRLGKTLTQVAQEWKAKADLWSAKAALIENIREGAKEQIAAAAAQAEVDAILAGLAWPKP